MSPFGDNDMFGCPSFVLLSNLDYAASCMPRCWRWELLLSDAVRETSSPGVKGYSVVYCIANLQNDRLHLWTDLVGKLSEHANTVVKQSRQHFGRLLLLWRCFYLLVPNKVVFLCHVNGRSMFARSSGRLAC